MLGKYTRLPQPREERVHPREHCCYDRTHPLACCLCSLDGKHVAIQQPVDSGSEFVKYKLFFSALAELVQGENTEATVLSFIYNNMYLASPLLSQDIARSHRFGAQRSGTLHCPIIMRFTCTDSILQRNCIHLFLLCEVSARNTYLTILKTIE